MKKFVFIKHALVSLAIATIMSTPAAAQDPDSIAQSPLFATSIVEPNVLFVLDDSGSMHWETMPDGLTSLVSGSINQYFMWMFPFVDGTYSEGTYGNRRVISFGSSNRTEDSVMAAVFRSPQFNTLYYNPAVTYEPWVRADGTSMPDAVESAAYRNPILTDGTGPGTSTLDADQTANVEWVDQRQNAVCTNPGWDDDFCERTYYPATYYFYIGEEIDDTAAAISNPGHAIWDEDLIEQNFDRVEIRSTQSTYSGHGRENRDDCGNTGSCTYAQEIQNFANWYTYHRSRIFASRAGIGRAFSEQSERMRVGYGTINSTNTVIHGVKAFDTATRGTFFDELYEDFSTSGTPLRNALHGAGQYFADEDDPEPWLSDPDDTNSPTLECRQSYTVLMTDGTWNGSTPSDIGNSDNSGGGTITGPEGQSFQYDPSDPFQDDHQVTLADVAMHYWKQDLQDSIDNSVPTNDLNPAFWQHMVTFGVGLGVEGSIDPDEAFEAIRTGVWGQQWPDPDNSNEAKIDDLLHAAVNSRGGFFSAKDAEQFSRDLSRVLHEIAARASGTTALATTSTRLESESLILQATFDSDTWEGNLWAFDPFADVDAEEEWQAADYLTEASCSTRNIYVGDGDNSSSAFEPSSFSGGGTSAVLRQRLLQSADFDAVFDDADTSATHPARDALVEHLCGDRTHENPGSTYNFRARGNSVLGDIVNSEIIFSGPSNEGWARVDSGYVNYIGTEDSPGTKRQRGSWTFVGANDGMLHAFNASSGEEAFAYIPHEVLPNLAELANPNYSHRYYVDGGIAVADAQIPCPNGSNGWCTVLVGSLGAGGRAIYALDVTRPGSFSEGNVLWEISADDYPELGFTFGRPQIARIKLSEDSYRFVAIFGNGYGSDPASEDVDPDAALFIVDLETGEPVQGDDPFIIADSTLGLSSPTIWWDPATREHVSRVYAGDLEGNLWRFDFGDSFNPQVALSGSPLFQAGPGRSITVAPAVAAHPSGGVITYFGTGKYFEIGDQGLTGEVDRFHAVRDLNSAVALSDLGEITMSISGDGRTFAGQASADHGWYTDLAVTDDNAGERVLNRATVFLGTVFFTTFEPIADDPCRPGGLARFYALGALNGRPQIPDIPGFDCPNCGGYTIGFGPPVNPPIVLIPPPVADPGDEDGPGNPPDTPPPPPSPGDPPTGSEADEWCDVAYVTGPDGQRIPIGSVCLGRQVWRQMF